MKPYGHRKIQQWFRDMTADELAKLNGVTVQSIHQHAKKHGLEYVRRCNKGLKFMNKTKTNTQVEVRELVKAFHKGDNSVIQQLNEFGLRAWRV